MVGDWRRAMASAWARSNCSTAGACFWRDGVGDGFCLGGAARALAARTPKAAIKVGSEIRIAEELENMFLTTWVRVRARVRARGAWGRCGFHRSACDKRCKMRRA